MCYRAAFGIVSQYLLMAWHHFQLMSKITEKRSFVIPPCCVDKDLVGKIGNLLQKEHRSWFEQVYNETKEKMKTDGFYGKYPDRLTDDAIRLNMPDVGLSYSLTSSSKNIESSDIGAFVGAEWPEDAKEILIQLGGWRSDKGIAVNLYLERWRMKRSEVVVSGADGTWVNGIATQLERIFNAKKLSYSPLVDHASVRWTLSLIAWASLLYAILRPLWQSLAPLFRANTSFESFYSLILLFGGFFVVIGFESFLNWLFPRFEYGKHSAAKSARGWIWGFLVGSGLLVSILLKLLGL
jgi:hypothetical protein